MPIHRDLEALQEQFSDLQNSFILSIFQRIKADQFSLFKEWSDAFMAQDEEKAIRLLNQLLNIPVRSLSEGP